MNVNQDILVTDINRRHNVAGDGINNAQRIMNAAEGGHLLLSSDLCNELMNREQYKGKFVEGFVDVKHGGELHVFQYIGAASPGLNRKRPDRLKSDRTPPVTGSSRNAPVPRSVGIHPIILPSDWKVLPNKDTPQHTAFREINLQGKLLADFRCTLHLESEYIRFGVKILPVGANVFGAKEIRTHDSLLLHIGKEINSSVISTSCYDGLVHHNKRKNLIQWEKGQPLQFLLSMNDDESLTFKLNGNEACTVPCPRAKRQRLVMMAWGDGHPHYEMSVTEARVAVSDT